MDFGSLNLGEIVLIGGLGELLMFLWNKQPLSKFISSKSNFFKEMFECDLCLGVWAFWILALIFGAYAFDPYIPVFSEFIFGAIMSFFAHLVRIGWQTKFGKIFIT